MRKFIFFFWLICLLLVSIFTLYNIYLLLRLYIHHQLPGEAGTSITLPFNVFGNILVLIMLLAIYFRSIRGKRRE
jgi:hypothetical protein